MWQIHTGGDSYSYRITIADSVFWSRKTTPPYEYAQLESTDYDRDDLVLVGDSDTTRNPTEGWDLGDEDEAGTGGPIRWGLNKLTNIETGKYIYLDHRDDSVLVFGVPGSNYGIDITILYDGSKGEDPFYARWQNPVRDWVSFRNGDTVEVWLLKDPSRTLPRVMRRWQPTDPTNLAITTENNHPKLTWNRSVPTADAKYNVERSIYEQGPFSVVNLDPLTNNYWVDGDIWTNMSPQRTYYYRVQALSGDELQISPGFSNIASMDGKLVPQKRSPNTFSDATAELSLTSFPNPFNPSAIIRFGLEQETDVHLSVFDMLGREVRTIISGRLDRGTHSFVFDASSLSSGTYYCRLTKDNGGTSLSAEVQRILLVR